MQTDTFKDKVVNVTGGANGIGRCIAEEFRSLGAAVHVIDKQESEHFVGDISKKECKSSFIDNCMIIGTSAMIETELDSIVNQYTDKFCNPMVMWGRYRHNWIKTTLPISFQFHHVQMDGEHGASFLEQLQQEIYAL